MHYYENTEEFAYNQSTGKRQYHRKSCRWNEKPLTTGDKALMAVGVLLVIVAAVMGVL
ncbi:hypothetical protein MYOV065v1_p0028 [Vibrio phage PS15B.2]|nr:hypothetical protein MYOV065v1_p0028 [Vibrio phage PS15B.2]QZI90834.1 hypothetical protein MYOV066v1_p0056 [Vibrio phage PS15B.3]QZI90878.1 hypothetical protein MYOV064v1_p0028 [Vibrio phage PS15B.4]